LRRGSSSEQNQVVLQVELRKLNSVNDATEGTEPPFILSLSALTWRRSINTPCTVPSRLGSRQNQKARRQDRFYL